jgi:hypothetical protein
VSSSRRRRIVIVDDDPATADELASSRSTEVLVRTPDQVSAADLQRADVVLVDFELSSWLDQVEADVAQVPRNGLALAAVLRSHISGGRAVAFALRTGHLPEIAAALPANVTEHAFARFNNLEWAFPRARPNGRDPILQVQALAKAVTKLPRWSSENRIAIEESLVRNLLGISAQKPWRRAAASEVQECHPPLQELYRETHGLALLRWLLHRILPYPCFLLDERHVAARLRLTPAEFRGAIQEPRLSTTLAPYRYTGILDDFLGPRWWRAGLEYFVWRATDGKPFDLRRLAAVIQKASGIMPHDWIAPVVCVDTSYLPSDTFVEADEAVRLDLDDWPPYAEPPWASVDAVRADEDLERHVAERDRSRI